MLLNQDNEIYAPCVTQIPGIKRLDRASSIDYTSIHSSEILHQFILLKYSIASFDLGEKKSIEIIRPLC